MRENGIIREKIILAPGLNGSELMKSLALHGAKSLGIRICGAAELARLALLRSGKPIAEDFVSAEEETAIVAEAVRESDYFKKASYSDIREIRAAIHRMRSLTAGTEEEEIRERLSQGIFKEKNGALFCVYQRYMALLESRKALDAISLVRKAIRETRVIDAEFLALEEYPLNPLEKALLDRISGGKAAGSSMPALFDKYSGDLKIESIRSCYGAANEVETILAELYSGRRLDQCTVAAADTSVYGQLFFDYALLYDLPVTFGCGIPIQNSSPARLLTMYHRWITSGFYGAEALGELLASEAFDRSKLWEKFPEKNENFHWSAFRELLGNLRLTNDSGINESRIADFRKAVEEEAERTGIEDQKAREILRGKQSCLPFLEVMGEELALPPEEFIARYAYIRRGSGTNAERLLMMLDLAAQRTICEELRILRSSGQDPASDDILSGLLKSSVCMQQSEAGMLHVTGIEGALSTMRPYLYLAGMSASHFPGAPKENYLLLDADLRLFGADADCYTSDGEIHRKRQQLLQLTRLASALESRVAVSYAGLNVSELKKDNASSMIFELFRNACGTDATAGDLDRQTETVDYFKPAVSSTRLVGEAYTKGKTILPDTASPERDVPGVPWNLDRAWSPTALDTYFGCKRRFMLSYLLQIPEPEEYDPFDIMNALDTGILAHSMMEELGRKDRSREEFLFQAQESFERFILEHPPLIRENVPPVREQFMEMMETAYDMDPHREVVLGEEDICCTHECGVRLHGYPDRVEKLDDGSCRIVDFKSGRTVSHVQDDIRSCLQVVFYAYLMEQRGFRVSGGEYRYIRLGETVSCRYDDDMKIQLSQKLEEFKSGLMSGSFPPAGSEDGDDPCRFCRYKGICGKEREEGTVDESGRE